MSKKYNVKSLPLAVLSPSNTNPRKVFEAAAMDNLRVSVEAQGVLVPLIVRPSGANGFYEIVAGERRFLAADAAGLTEVPCIVRTMTDVEVVEAQVVENMQRESMTPLEEAACFQSLLDLRDAEGLEVYSTAADIARRLGVDARYVRGRVSLRKLPDAAQEALAAQELDLFAAMAVARLPREEDRVAAADMVLAKELNGQDAVDYIAWNFSRSLKGVPWSYDDDTLVPGRKCEGCPMREENICRDKECFDGHVEAEYLRWAASVAGEGREVLSREENAKVVNEHGLMGWVCGLVELDSRPAGLLLHAGWRERDDVPTWRTMTEEIGVPVVVVRLWDHTALECVSSSLAIEAARQNGYDIFAHASEGKRERAERVRQEGLARAEAFGKERKAWAARVKKVGAKANLSGEEDAMMCLYMLTAELSRGGSAEMRTVLAAADVVWGRLGEMSAKEVCRWAAQVMLATVLVRGADVLADELEEHVMERSEVNAKNGQK